MGIDVTERVPHMIWILRRIDQFRDIRGDLMELELDARHDDATRRDTAADICFFVDFIAPKNTIVSARCQNIIKAEVG